MKKLVLIDGNSLMFRAYYATSYTGNLMKSSKGIYTNALFGFASMMTKVMEIEDITHMFVAFDTKEKTFRHHQYEDYKGTRKVIPDELVIQIPLIKEYLDVLGVKRLEVPGYEADDLIGTVACKAYDEIDQIIIISSDKDLLQLVNDKTSVLLTKKGLSDLDEYNNDNFFEKVGFYPHQVIHYKGMVGDNSDNLPGIKGVGPKTALNLLTEYGTLEKVIENVEQLKGRLQEQVRADQEIALRTKELATIKCDCDIDVNIKDTFYQGYDLYNLIKFYESVDFKIYIDQLQKNNNIKKDEETLNNIEIIINDIERFNQEKIEKAYIGLEIDQENYHRGNILGFSILTKNTGFYFEPEYLKNEDIINFFEDEAITKKVMDLKRLYVALKYQGIEVKGVDFDLLLAAYIINPSFASNSIGTLASNFISTDIELDEVVFGKKGKANPETRVIAEHSLKKCQIIKSLEPILEKKLKEYEQWTLLVDLEMPLALVLGDVEISGFKLDEKVLDDIGAEFLKKELELEQKIYQLSGEKFNINSPKQLSEVLFEKLKLPTGKKTKTGYSTAAPVLEKLAKDYEIVRVILEYRKYAKLLSTYITGLKQEIYPDGKVHTIFKQALTLTGRLSSVNPNIQNIPIRSDDGKIIRSAFVPSFKDGYLVSADYSQIELRILAHLADEEEMIKDFSEDADFHSLTAAKVFNVPVENVTSEMRRNAKAVNFGIIYGMSDWGLSETLGISQYDASTFIKRYFEAYPKIKQYLDQAVKEAKSNGYTETIFKRRRYIPELASSNYQLMQFGERTAMNAPIQGSAADIIKKAMIDVNQALKTAGLKSKIVSQIHDELVLDVAKDELDKVKFLVKKAMESAVQLKVDLKVEVDHSYNWNID